MLYKDLRIPYSRDKGNSQTDNCENLERTALIELCSFLISDILAFELGKYARGWGFCFVFSTRGRSFALKSCPRGADFDGKN